MAKVSPANQVLLALADRIRPRANAELAADREVLIVASITRKVEVEAIATVTTTLARSAYRNVRTWRVYGWTSDPESAAAAILADLCGEPN